MKNISKILLFVVGVSVSSGLVACQEDLKKFIGTVSEQVVVNKAGVEQNDLLSEAVYQESVTLLDQIVADLSNTRIATSDIAVAFTDVCNSVNGLNKADAERLVKNIAKLEALVEKRQSFVNANPELIQNIQKFVALLKVLLEDENLELAGLSSKTKMAICAAGGIVALAGAVTGAWFFFKETEVEKKARLKEEKKSENARIEELPREKRRKGLRPRKPVDYTKMQ